MPDLYDPTVDEQDERLGGPRTRPRMALPGAVPQGPPPIDAAVAPGASVPQGGMKAQIAPPEPAAPAMALPGIGPKLGADRAELQRLQETGSGVEQLRKSHPIGGTIATIADAVGGAMFPSIAANIPGTSVHHNQLVNRAQGAVNQDLAGAERQAQVEHLNAETEDIGNPKAAGTPEALTLHDLMTGENGQPRVNPDTGKPYTYLEAYQKVQKQPAPRAPLLHETDQGVFLVDPETHQATPLTFNGQTLKPKPKEATSQEKDISDFLAANKLEDTPENREKARDMIARRAPAARVSVTPQTDKNTARADRSYQLHSGKLDKLSEPITQAIARMGRLQETLHQGTPQADALVAPELLTVMAGGAGSGLRMNEAEIARIVGGRSAYENLKASIQHFASDPSKANSITPAQRIQINALVKAVNDKLIAKQKVLDDGSEGLINAEDPMEHRRILNDVRHKLTAIDEGKAGGGGITVTAPNGKTYTFTDQKAADDFKARAGIK